MRGNHNSEGLKIRRHILQKIKEQVQLHLGVETSGLRNYALAYKKAIERPGKPTTLPQLQEAMVRSPVIIGGDFHAYAQAQRVHLRQLRELVLHCEIILGLECIESRHQKTLDKYMSGAMDEASFLKKVSWDKNWGFPWENYKPLLQFIKDHGGRCLALNQKTAGLKERDRHAAKLILEAYKKLKTNQKIYVVFGDLHVAYKHLPEKVDRFLKKDKKRCLVLYLNPEKIYFHLFRKNLENKTTIVRFTDSEFCLLESPPWVKWQSYLMFLEENADKSMDDPSIDYNSHLRSLLQLFANDFQLLFSEDVRLASLHDHDFLDLLADIFDQKKFQFFKVFVENGLNFYDSTTRFGYLARNTVNYVAHLAGLIFHAQNSQPQAQEEDAFPSDFEKQIWKESIAFFLSKNVNPHRKSPSLTDLKKHLAVFFPRDKGEKILKLALDQKMRELLLSYSPTGMQLHVYKKLPLAVFLSAAKILGEMLGEKIYVFYKTGRLSRLQIQKWIQTSLERKDFNKFYIQVLREIDKLESGEKHGR